ncbi:hypothetical protein [Paenibacillus sp. J22TS3]|nr:hypothetical protein [Paenibacillus sp. J22TS3]
MPSVLTTAVVYEMLELDINGHFGDKGGCSASSESLGIEAEIGSF